MYAVAAVRGLRGTQQFSNDEILGEDSSINATFIIDFGGELQAIYPPPWDSN